MVTVLRERGSVEGAKLVSRRGRRRRRWSKSAVATEVPRPRLQAAGAEVNAPAFSAMPATVSRRP